MALFTTPSSRATTITAANHRRRRRLRGRRHNLLAIQFMTFLPGTVGPNQEAELGERLLID